MTANVQGSASGIGMAPQAGAGLSADPSATGPLPSLTGGAATGAAGDPMVAGTDPTAGGAGQAAAGAGAAAPAGFDMTKYASQGRWLGPLATMGGGFAAYKGLSSGNKWMKIGGVAAALGGLALTGIGFKAKGIETGTKATEAQAVAAMQQLTAQYETTMQQLATQASTEITTLQQQLAQAQQAGAVAGTDQGVPGQGATDGSGGAVGPGLGGTTVPGSGSGTPGTSGTTGTQGTGPTGAWSVQSIVGRSVDLAAGATPSGAVVADPGSYRIEQVAGDANGYATLEEANAAARASMSTELMGSKFLRWMVVEHEGRYYGAIAKQVGQGEQPNPISADIGNVVAWSAMNHVTDNGVNGWKAYSWTQSGGAQLIDVPYGSTNVFGGVSGGGPVGSAPGTGTGSAPTGTGSVVDDAINQVTGGGQVQPGNGTPFDPASQVGRSFSINASTTAEGDLARGGTLQVQKFVDTSAGGFGTAEEAATAARSARAAAGGGDQWSRWLTLAGSDGRFYVYQGSIVSKATAELQAAPVHVFGVGFAEYFDGASNSWRAIRESRQAVA